MEGLHWSVKVHRESQSRVSLRPNTDTTYLLLSVGVGKQAIELKIKISFQIRRPFQIVKSEFLRAVSFENQQIYCFLTHSMRWPNVLGLTLKYPVMPSLPRHFIFFGMPSEHDKSYFICTLSTSHTHQQRASLRRIERGIWTCRAAPLDCCMVDHSAGNPPDTCHQRIQWAEWAHSHSDAGPGLRAHRQGLDRADECRLTWAAFSCCLACLVICAHAPHVQARIQCWNFWNSVVTV